MSIKNTNISRFWFCFFLKGEYLSDCLWFFELVSLMTDKMHFMGYAHTVSGDLKPMQLTVLERTLASLSVL